MTTFLITALCRVCTSLGLLTAFHADWRLRLHTVQFSLRATHCTTKPNKVRYKFGERTSCKETLRSNGCLGGGVCVRLHKGCLEFRFHHRASLTDWSLSCISVQPASTETKKVTNCFSLLSLIFIQLGFTFFCFGHNNNPDALAWIFSESC